jgi:DNA-binding MarR family transcriptional regulator
MTRQPPAGKTRELAVVLHDLAWSLPRKIDPWGQGGPEQLPRTEFEVMRLLTRAPELSVGEVAHELGLQPSNTSAAIRGLVARGLLERRQDGRDGRISRLTPTAKAQAIRREREGTWGQVLRARLAQLPAEDAAQLLAAVDALRSLAKSLNADAE